MTDPSLRDPDPLLAKLEKIVYETPFVETLLVELKKLMAEVAIEYTDMNKGRFAAPPVPLHVYQEIRKRFGVEEKP